MRIQVPQDKNEWMPLHLASRGGHVEFARALPGYGADARAQNKNHLTPLHWPSEAGLIEVALVLLDYGADPNAE